MLRQVCSDEILEILSLSADQRNDAHIKKLKNFCHNLSYFEMFSNDSPEEQDLLDEVLRCVRVQYNKMNDHLFDIYGKPAKYFIIIEGKVNIYQKLILPIPSQDDQSADNLQNMKEDLIYSGLKLSLLQMKQKGDSVGMIDLMYKRNYQTAAICQTECLSLIINQSDFLKSLKDFEHKNMMKTIQFLVQIPHFSNQSFGYLRDIAVNSNHLINLRGDILYHENQNSDSVYIIKSGEYAIHKSYDRKALITSPIEKIIQDNIQEQGGPLFLGSPHVKKELKLKIMSQHEIFGEEDIIKGMKTRNHSVICESRKAECYQISANLFISKVIDLESTRTTFSEIQKNKQISTVHQDKGIKVSMKNYKNFYFEEKIFSDNSPTKIQEPQKQSAEFPSLQQSHRKSPLNNNDENLRSPRQFDKRDMNFSMIMNSTGQGKQNDKFPSINILPVQQQNQLNYTFSQGQLTTNQNESMEDIQGEQIPLNRISQEIIPVLKSNIQMVSISKAQDESAIKLTDDIAFTETTGIRKQVLKKKQSMKIHQRRNSRDLRSNSLLTESLNNGRDFIGSNPELIYKPSRIINLENDASFGVDNIKDLQKIITTSHVKNELSAGQPKDLNNYGRLSMQKNYERNIKEKPKDIQQVYTFELDEKERQKVIVRKQKYRNYINDWKKSPSPPQSCRGEEQENSFRKELENTFNKEQEYMLRKEYDVNREPASKKEQMSKNKQKAIQEAIFLQSIEKNKNQIEELNHNALLSSFYTYSNNPQSSRGTQQNTKSVQSKEKQYLEHFSNQTLSDLERQNILQPLSYQRTKSPLAIHLIEQNQLNNKQQNKTSAIQDYTCTPTIEPQVKSSELSQQKVKQLAAISHISKIKEKEELQQQQPFLSYRGNGAKNQISNLWKQKLSINQNTQKRRNASSHLEQSLSARNNYSCNNKNNDLSNFMLSSQSSLKYVNNENQKDINKRQNINRLHEISITPNYLNALVDQSQGIDDSDLINQSVSSQYRMTSILTTHSRGKRKKAAQSIDFKQKNNHFSLNSNTQYLTKNQNTNGRVINFGSILKKQNPQNEDQFLKENEQKSSGDVLETYHLKPVYKN